MLRASLILALLAGMAGASAGTKKWSIELPPSWTDVTADALKEPSIVAFKRQINDMGGSFEASAYANEGGEYIVVATIEVTSMPATLAELDAFESAARTRGNQGGTEASYQKATTATTWSATQRVAGKELPIVTRRFEGFLQVGGLRAISLNCYGTPTVCDPLVASATVDTSSFVNLASIDAGGSSLARRIGFLVGSVLVVLVLVGSVWQRRRRPAPPI